MPGRDGRDGTVPSRLHAYSTAYRSSPSTPSKKMQPLPPSTTHRETENDDTLTITDMEAQLEEEKFLHVYDELQVLDTWLMLV